QSDAKLWVKNYENALSAQELQSLTWDTLKDAFLTYHNTGLDLKQELEDKLHTACQSISQPTEAFIEYVENLINQIDPTMTTPTRIRWILRGMRKDVSKTLAPMECKSL